MAQAAEPSRIGLGVLMLLIEHDWSVVRKPVPLTLMNVPRIPDPGLSVSLGPAVTFNTACAKSPWSPLTWITY